LLPAVASVIHSVAAVKLPHGTVTLEERQYKYHRHHRAFEAFPGTVVVGTNDFRSIKRFPRCIRGIRSERANVIVETFELPWNCYTLGEFVVHLAMQ
jgi:hypothetical protein